MPHGRVLTDPRPVVLGHRGSGTGTVGGHPENSLPSFRAAVAAGATWVEADVRRCADDALVVMHHPSTPEGRFVVDLTAEQVVAGGGLLLADLLAWLPRDIGLDVDVKTCLEDAVRPPERTTTGLLVPVLDAERARRRLIVTSFDPAALLQVRRDLPDVPLGLLTWLYFPLRKAVPAAHHLGLDIVGAHAPSFGLNEVDSAPVHREPAHAVRVAHEAGLEVVAWCPDAARAVELAEAGVDGLVVNDVPGVRRALDAWRRGEPGAVRRTG
ncbi:MAG: glycerophosphodiester phosphodiesterase [Actinomycetes bacterium]